MPKTRMVVSKQVGNDRRRDAGACFFSESLPAFLTSLLTFWTFSINQMHRSDEGGQSKDRTATCVV